MLRNCERNALYWHGRKPEIMQNSLERLQAMHQRHGRTYRYNTVAEALRGNLERARGIRKRLGLPENLPVYQPTLSDIRHERVQ